MRSETLPLPAGGLHRRSVDRRAGLLGLVTSLGLHLLVLGLLILRWPQAQSPIAEPEPMTVEFLVEHAEPAPARPEKPKPPQDVPDNLEIAATSTSGRIPVPAAKPKPPAKTAPARPRIEPVPRSKPRPPSRFDPERVAALLDKARKRPSASASPADRAPRDKKSAEHEIAQNGAARALRERLAKASLGQALAARVSRCWTAPVGAKGVESMRVRIAVQLSREGRLVGLPRFLDVDSRRLKTDPYYRVFVESARRAVLACAPYDDLPQPLYRLWRRIEFTFSPRNMY